MTRDGRPWARGLGVFPSGSLGSTWADEDPQDSEDLQDPLRLRGSGSRMPDAGTGLRAEPLLLPSPLPVSSQLQQLGLGQQQQLQQRWQRQQQQQQQQPPPPQQQQQQYLYQQLPQQPQYSQQQQREGMDAVEIQAAPQPHPQQPLQALSGFSGPGQALVQAPYVPPALAAELHCQPLPMPLPLLVRERWAVEVGKDMPRLLDYVLHQPQVQSGQVSLHLIFVMCDVPCAMGIAFRVSEMEARVADIHEKHIFKTVLSPLVNEIRRKRRKVQVQAHVEREDKVDTGLVEAAKRLRISRLVITSRRTTGMRKKKASSDGLSETYVRQLKDMDCTVVVLQGGKKPRMAEPSSWPTAAATASFSTASTTATAPGTPTSTTAAVSSPSAHRPAACMLRSSTLRTSGVGRPQSSGSWRSHSASTLSWGQSGVTSGKPRSPTSPEQAQGQGLGGEELAVAYPQAAHSYHGGTILQRQTQQQQQQQQSSPPTLLAQRQGAQQPHQVQHLQQQQHHHQGQGQGPQVHSQLIQPQTQAERVISSEGQRGVVSQEPPLPSQQSLPSRLPGQAAGQMRRKLLWKRRSSSPQLALALARTNSDVTAASTSEGLTPLRPCARTLRSCSDSNLFVGGGLGLEVGAGAGRLGGDDMEGALIGCPGVSGSSGGGSSLEDSNSDEGTLPSPGLTGLVLGLGREQRGGRGGVSSGGVLQGAGSEGKGGGAEAAPLESLVQELRRLQVRLHAAHQEEETLRRAVDEAQDEVKSAISQKEEESLRLVACEAELGIAKFQFQEASHTVAMLKAEVDMARRAAAEALEVAELAKRKMEMAQLRQQQGGAADIVAGPPGPEFPLQPLDFRKYTFQELSQATGGWKRLLRNGDSGLVYHGLIEGHQPVAIRVLKDPTAPGALEEFEREVKMGQGLRHPNLVLLMGCCQDPPCLVYEYMPQGSLHDRLVCRDGSPPLHWATRFDIFSDVCAALMHLHCRENPIVHFDLKPSNVLLDKKFVAKLGDVGLARIMRRLTDDTVSVPLGTWGYACPELLRSNLFCSRTDVYSLGMVLYDLLGGDSSTRTQGLVQAMEQAVSDMDLKRMGQLTDPAAKWPPELAMELASMARDCTGARRRDRPEVAKEILPCLERLRPMVEHLMKREASENRRRGLGGRSLRLLSAASQDEDESRGEPCVPRGFRCPITLDLMENPVMAADGHTYEEAAIQQWLRENETSPVTNAPLVHKHLTPNYNLRSLIQDWKDRRLLHRPSYEHLNLISRSSSFSSQRSVACGPDFEGVGFQVAIAAAAAGDAEPRTTAAAAPAAMAPHAAGVCVNTNARASNGASNVASEFGCMSPLV